MEKSLAPYTGASGATMASSVCSNRKTSSNYGTLGSCQTLYVGPLPRKPLWLVNNMKPGYAHGLGGHRHFPSTHQSERQQRT